MNADEISILGHRLEHAIAAREDALEAYDRVKQRADSAEQALMELRTRMTFDEYQQEALRTAGNTQGDERGLSMTALGLTGEAGEYADLVKKHLYHSHEMDREKAKKELGDIAWYLAVAAYQHGFSLSEVIEGNVKKLRARYPAGFDPERSKNRAPEDK